MTTTTTDAEGEDMRKCFLCGVNVPANCRHYCRPIQPALSLAEIVHEHTLQVQVLTQRIGELCQQVNERDAKINTAIGEISTVTKQRDALLEVCRQIEAVCQERSR